jgi:hypothetical protein
MWRRAVWKIGDGRGESADGGAMGAVDMGCVEDCAEACASTCASIVAG